jgi:hypothetical protein
MKFSFFLALSFATAVHAQTSFQVYPGTEDLIEGGRVEKLTVISKPLQFNVRPPRGWYRQVDDPGQKIIFTSESGKSAIIVQFTTNSPIVLPPESSLRAAALRAHPGAAVVQSMKCPTGYRPGVFVDLVRVAGPGVVQRMRHAFVAHPDGEAQFILNASDDEFEKDKLILMGMLRDFRVQSLKPRRS